MFWKLAFIAVLAGGFTGVLGSRIVSEEQINQINDVLKMLCVKSNGASNTQEATNAVQKFGDCTKDILDPDTLKQEIKEARPVGELDKVFKKYCSMSPKLKTCLNSLTAAVTPCLPAAVLQHIDTVSVTDKLVDFICYKDGDRIALFIAEEGQKCIQDNAHAIRQCSTDIKQSLLLRSQNLTIADKCAKFDQFSSCVVTALGGCETSIPMITQSLLEVVRTITPCNKIKEFLRSSSKPPPQITMGEGQRNYLRKHHQKNIKRPR